MRHQPLGVAEHGPADSEGPRRRHRHHQVQHRRLLRGPRDQPPGGGHQADGAAERETAEQQREGEPAAPGSGQGTDPAQRPALRTGAGGGPAGGGRSRILDGCGGRRGGPGPCPRGRGRLRQSHDPVGHLQQRRAVHHQQDRPAARQLPYRRHDLGLGRPVEGGRRLVQQQHRPVREERPGQRQPLPLPGGQPGPVLAEYRLQALGQLLDEGQRPGVPQRLAYGGVVGVGPGQPYVLGDGRGIQVRALRHPGHLGVPARQVEAGELGSPDAHPSLRRADEAEQHVEERGLARPARADQRDRLPGLDGEADVRHRVGRAAGVADGHPFEGKGTARGHRTAAALRFRGLQHREDVLGRRQALGRRVVLRPDLPQRQIRLGREHQHDQTVVQGHVAVDEAHADRHGDQCHRERGEQFQGEGRQEGDPQRPHGRLPVLAGDPPDGLGLRLGPAEHLQRRQARDHVEEVTGQLGQQPPLPVHPGLGDPADQHHEDRDERQGDDDDGRRHPVLGDDPDQHGHGDDHREAQLRQIAREVVVQGVDPPGGQGDQGAGALSAEPAGAEGGRPLQQPSAQLRLDRRARPVRGQLGEPADQSPAAGDGRQQQQGSAESGRRHTVLKGADHDLGDEHRLGDDQSRADGAETDDGDQKEPGGAGVPQETWIDGFHVKHALSSRRCVSRETVCRTRRTTASVKRTLTGLNAWLRRGAGYRCACGTPSTSSPGRPGRPACRWPRARS
ncbi:hypothetical protein SFUMM280S_10308 [Streptomyces fumanus]